MSADASAAPRWDLTPIFPSLTSPEFRAEFTSVLSEIDALCKLFEEKGVRRRAKPDVDAAFAADYEIVTNRINSINDRLRVLGSYLDCHTTTDAKDDVAKSLEDELIMRCVPLEQAMTRYTAWVGTTDVVMLMERSDLAAIHSYPIARAQHHARHQMSEAEEELTAELRTAGFTGWAKLHGNLTALMTVAVRIAGEERILPMSAVRALAADPDRETRRVAFEAELKAWEAAEVPLAAALNGIKGFQQTVRKRRGYADDVEPTLFSNGIDAPTLAAMQQACIESFPDFRRYMSARARALGLERLTWYDLSAPSGSSTRRWTWAESEDFIRHNFGRYSPRLAEFADRAFRERWIDAESRVGKVGGAYCTGLRPGESRILQNFDGAFGQVSTLAHELGHGYHNLNLRDQPAMLRSSPSTLAETASIFCETLAFDGAMASVDATEQLSLLETVMERNLMVVVDIHSRFLFEKAVFAKRSERDLTANEFKELMLDSQRQTYGEELEPLHPYMWAVKGHYYGPTFYNYPYTFGLLFALGLYAIYQREPGAFRANYDSLLASTGEADAATLAARFGIDVRSVDFWRGSLDIIRGQIAQFEALTQ